MAYGLDLRLFVENGPTARSAARSPSSSRIAAGLRRAPLLPANDQAPAGLPDGYPVAL